MPKRKPITWEERVGALLRYSHKHPKRGANVPSRWTGEGPGERNLGKWVLHQRNRFNKGILDPDLEGKLRGLGLRLETKEIPWEERVGALVRYSHKHPKREATMPISWTGEGPGEKNLGRWVHNQRQLFSKGILDPGREEKLRSLGLRLETRKTVPGGEQEKFVNYIVERGRTVEGKALNDKTEAALWKLRKMEKERAEGLEAQRDLCDLLLKELRSQCIKWPHSTARGYGLIWYNGKRWGVSRLVLTLFDRPPADPEMHAAHGPCNDSLCNNLDHLSFKTPFENLSKDKTRDNTSKRGSKHPIAKLNQSQVVEIRELYSRNKCTVGELSTLFNLTESSIRYVLTGTSYVDEGGPLHQPKPHMTPVQVEEMRNLYWVDKKTKSELLEMFDINKSHFYSIVSGQSWKTAGGPTCAPTPGTDQPLLTDFFESY
jgi:hypothetical protein